MAVDVTRAQTVASLVGRRLAAMAEHVNHADGLKAIRICVHFEQQGRRVREVEASIETREAV